MLFTITVEGQTQLLSSFLMVQKGVVDLRQLGTWDWVQSEFYKVIKEQFASEGGSGRSGKWKALSPKYAAIKAKRYGPMPILQASGKAYRSLTSEGGNAFVEKKAQEMTLGTTLDYPGYHQTGTKKMPKRPIFDFTPEQEKRITAPIVTKLKQLVANAKLRDLRNP